MNKLFIYIIICLLLVGTAFAAITDGNELYYSLDDVDLSGSNPTDLSGNARTGTTTGATTGVTGILNQGFSFDGSGDKIDTPSTGTLDDLSISFWMKKDVASGYPSSGFPGLVSSQPNSASIYISTLFHQSFKDKILFSIQDGGVTRSFYTTTGITDTNWHHIVVTRSNNAMDIWVDGVNRSLTAQYSDDITGSTFSGVETTFDVANSVNQFAGDMDEIAIWSRKLSSTEIAELYNSGSAYNPYSVSASNFTITSNTFGSDQLMIFNATVNGVNYATTTGEIVTAINSSQLVNVTIGSNLTNTYIYEQFINFNSSNLLTFNYTILNITAQDAITSSSIFNFTINLSTNTRNMTIDTNSGNTTLWLTPNTYTIVVDSPGYSLSNSSDIWAKGLQNKTYNLYAANTIYIRAYNQTSGSLISGQTVTIDYEGASTGSTTTTTGAKYIQNLTTGNYTISISSTGYEGVSYQVTVGNRTFQTLDAYLGASSSTNVILTLIDLDTGSNIEDGTVTIKTNINGTSTVVSSLSSDITGRVQFGYETGRAYTFIVSHPDYTSKNFTLDPIIFSSYNVRLEKVAADTDVGDYAGISISYSPDYIITGATNNFTFTFSSPSGEFLYYGFNLTWNGSTTTFTASNAYGSSLNGNILINNAEFTDRLKIEYFYQKSTGNPRNYTLYLTTISNIPNKYTFADNIGNTYGLGVLDRIFIVTIIVFVMFGTGYLFGGLPTAGTMALSVMGFFAWIELVPRWSLIISMILLVIVISWRSTS